MATNNLSANKFQDSTQQAAQSPFSIQTAKIAKGATSSQWLDNDIVTLIPGQTTTVKVQAGHFYKVRSILPSGEGGALQIPDNVIAIHKGDSLFLRYSDGSNVTFEDFYTVCKDALTCSVNVVSDASSGISLSSDMETGGVYATEGGKVLYAHGERDTLMAMAEGQTSMEKTFATMGDGPLLTYLPQTYIAPPGLLSEWDGLAVMGAVVGASAISGAAGGGGSASGSDASRNVAIAVTPPPTPQLALHADTGTSDSDKVTNDQVVKVNNLQANAQWQYQIDGGAWNNGTGTSFNMVEGTHNYAVRQTDAAGHISSPSDAVSFTYDATAATPQLKLDTDSGISNTDGITNVATVNVLGLETDATWQHQIDGGNWIAGTGNSFNLSAGTHNYTVRQTDAAGNVSNTSSGINYTYDATAATPQLALASDTGTSNTDGITNVATVKVLDVEAGATWQYQIDGGSWITGTGSGFSLSAGTHSYAVHQTDVAGNVSSTSVGLNYTYDATAAKPQLALASDTGLSGTDGITNVASVNVLGLETGGAWQYQIDGGNWITGTGSSFNLSAGTHNYAVHQTDVAGNVSGDSTSIQYTLDTSALSPQMRLFSDAGSSPTDGITNAARIDVLGVETGATWQYQVDGGSWITGTDQSFNMTVGTHSYAVRQTDAAGNVSDTSGISQYTLDVIPPAVPTLTLQTDTGSNTSDGITSAGLVNVHGLESGAAWQYKVDSDAWVNGSGSSFTLTQGAHAYSVRQTDVAGNVTSNSPVNYTLDTAAPTLTPSSANPNVGVAVVHDAAQANVFHLTFTFSENVVDFTTALIATQQSASIQNFAGSGNRYIADVVYNASFVANQQHTVDIAGNSYNDAAGNINDIYNFQVILG